ncbi:hypothetical protein GCM10007392_30910 [Saccharospirillum salsuginis]|uniref:Segregation and condensation protein B n=2 Tax=Saccharospirillum salsuginis TaxID=418750 RepID=A0A918KGX4_9GAMM|nr:hypothetical protein GCM10007392_30910 [Saccharospirillum salsuginis]
MNEADQSEEALNDDRARSALPQEGDREAEGADSRAQRALPQEGDREAEGADSRARSALPQEGDRESEGGDSRARSALPQEGDRESEGADSRAQRALPQEGDGESEDSGGSARRARQEDSDATEADASAPDTDPAAHDDPDALGADEADGEDEEEVTEKGDPYGGHSPEAVKRILEGALFAAGTALSIVQLAALFEEHERPHRKILRSLVAELMAHYQGGGFELIEVASGYRFQTRSDVGHWISRLWEERPARYSRAMLETLALIAYRQPITRGEIEDVRGVSVSSSIVKTLQEREWVRVVGHRDVPGRPAMYATTRQFLDYFGLRSLDQLPSLGEIRDLDDINPQMGLNESGPDGQNPDSAGSVDQQAEISFSAMVDKLREGERTGKTGNEFIDEQLDGQLSEMDAVNEAIEQAFDAQRANHNQPGLELSDEDEGSEGEVDEGRARSALLQGGDESGDGGGAPTQESDDSEDSGSALRARQDSDEASENNESTDDTPLSEEEQWRIIQEKLAQQQALLDGRENDQSGGDDTDE